MSYLTNADFRLKFLVSLTPAVAALLYFAWSANPLIALVAGASTLAACAFLFMDKSSEGSNDQAGQLEAIGKSLAVIEFQIDGTIITANENFLNTMNYTLEEIKGNNHSMFVENETTSSVEYRSFWDQLRKGEHQTAEFKRLGKNGKEVWIQASYNPILDRQGTVVKVVKYATDVTAQKLKNADAQGQLDAMGKSQAVIEFELDGTVITANQNFLDAMGYTLDEVQGKHHRLFAEPEFAASAEYRAFWDKLGRGEYDAGMFKRIGKGGKEVWIRASYNPILDPNNKPYKVVKYAADITDTMLADANYRGQIEAIGRTQAVIEFELDGTIIHANENFLKTTGYSLEEVVGKHHRIFVEKSEAHGTEYQSFWDNLARGEYLAGQFKRIHKNGSEVWIDASYNPILDLNGKPFKVVKYAVDITERRLQNLENEVVRQAINTVSSNVVVADRNFDIIYMNPRAVELFKEGESQIRTVLPQFNSNNVIGSNIDIFHKNPSNQRRLLETLNSPHVVEIPMGAKLYKAVASPLFEDGQRVGAVLEWYDRTQEASIEAEVADVVQSAMAGDLSKRISMAGKDGFFEILSEGVNQLVGISERVIDDTIRVLSAIAEGNLTETIDSDYEGSYEKLKSDANATVTKLTEVVTKIKSSASSVKTGADEISQGNGNLSQRTEEQASSLEETATSMEEMTGTVRQNAENATQANQLAIEARRQAEKGGAVVSDAVKAMAEINTSSKKISDIIGVIDEIAFQTNLLALNASVEAARAGDQGRGFAVVASEVRNLAGRSATAAKEIKDLIEDSGSKVDEGSRLVNESGETLQEIVIGVKKVTDIVGEIASASQEQSSGIDEVNKAITQMDELTQQNAALVEEAAAASESLGEQADHLNQMMTFFSVNGGEIGSQSSMFDTPARRTPQRSWSTAANDTPAAKRAAPPPPTPIKQAASGGGSDQEWEEF